jgi:hypothetical protein
MAGRFHCQVLVQSKPAWSSIKGHIEPTARVDLWCLTTSNGTCTWPCMLGPAPIWRAGCVCNTRLLPMNLNSAADVVGTRVDTSHSAALSNSVSNTLRSRSYIKMACILTCQPTSAWHPQCLCSGRVHSADTRAADTRDSCICERGLAESDSEQRSLCRKLDVYTLTSNRFPSSTW